MQTSQSWREARQTIRNQMKAKRLALTTQQQTSAALDIIPQALALIEHYQASHLAFYLPFKAEISPLPLIKQLLTQGKSIYLPVLHPFSAGNLLFVQYQPNSVLQSHSFGMLQPQLDIRQVKPLDELEMIFTPLLACDKQLNRLGYGGGFYDRTLAQTSAINVGLAYDCQLIEQLPTEDWDMPLDHLILGDTA
ncbi:5-formyltetrahydrofolate cyclo-ligase [Actinobacillus vicugnae]|uniref:5-formyltetrahydrofolate cyclo-ligase n=1 Tax=Actinobacillus vicugnae TaxID=2573093 RepID=UPI0012406EEF|nr:5-formyltetrahydrofolate cyclo-ligase [Actinobacillus vicugnae]